MTTNRRFLRAVAAALAVSGVALAAPPSSVAGVGRITLPDLFGDWTATFSGFTGCGQVAMLATINMNASGVGTATLTTHGQCGDSVLTGQTFQILSLNATTGRGTAGLSCGPGCGWSLQIHVAPDRQTMSIVDVSSANPGNYIAGVATHN